MLVRKCPRYIIYTFFPWLGASLAYTRKTVSNCPGNVCVELVYREGRYWEGAGRAPGGLREGAGRAPGGCREGAGREIIGRFPGILRWGRYFYKIPVFK